MPDLIPFITAVVGEVMCLNATANTIFTGITTYLNGRDKRLMKKIVIGIDERVRMLEEKIDKDYIKSDDYKNFLYKTIRMAVNDERNEKFNLFANIMVNAALIGNADENDGRKYLYDETIDKLDEKLFGFLLKMSTRKMTTGNKKEAGWKGDCVDLKQLGVDESTFFFYSDYLLSVGVLVRLPVMEVTEGVLSYHPEYFVTQYGADFVEYVREQ